MAEHTLDTLLKLMPTENFDGNGNNAEELRKFIKQVDSIFELATENQKPILLLFVKNKLSGKARSQVDIHCNLTTWEGISELLIRLFQPRITLEQLFQKLNLMKQEPHETVDEFCNKLEELESRALGAIHASGCAQNLIAGQEHLIKTNTLSRFILNTHPLISQMLRYRNFNNLKDARAAATQEETTLNLTYKTNNLIKCQICQRTNHTANNCFKYTQNKNSQSSTNGINSRSVNYNSASRASSSNSQQIKQCRYCKNNGHTIEECRKRQRNNSYQNTHPNYSPRPNCNQNQNNYSHTNTSNPNRQATNTNYSYPKQNSYKHNPEQRGNVNYSENFPLPAQLTNPPITMEEVMTDFNGQI